MMPKYFSVNIYSRIRHLSLNSANIANVARVTGHNFLNDLSATGAYRGLSASPFTSNNRH
jgi:hypothetical protein